MAKDTNENKKKAKISTKSMILFIILLILFVLLIPVGYALFSDTDNEILEIKAGNIHVTLTEDPQWRENDDEYGIEKYEKNVKGVAAADCDLSYVRIRVVPIVQYYDSTTEEWITAPVPQENIAITLAGTDWEQSGEYWYYKNPIKKGEETDNLNIKWTLTEVPQELTVKEHIRTDVRVILEAKPNF